MKRKKLACLVLSAIFAWCISGCNLVSVQKAEPQIMAVNSGVHPSVFAHSFVGDVDVYVPGELQEEMDDFGKAQYIQPAEAVIAVYTDVPKQENDAKGKDPLCIVMPQLDAEKYSSHYIWRDDAAGLEVNGYYRTVAGVLTDELVKVYVDTSGSIVRYETVNLGKYDALHIADAQVESMRISLKGQISGIKGDWIMECVAPVSHPVSNAYILFEDAQGRIVLQTRAALKTNTQIRQVVTHVDLYAIMDP